MNKNIAILSAAALLLAIALFIYLRMDHNSLSGVAPNVANLSADEQKGLLLLKVAQESCLAGESKDSKVMTELFSDFISKFEATAGVQSEKARGGVNYLNEKVRSLVDKDIRDCLQKHMPKIQACLLGDCSSASLPQNIEFRFTYQPQRDNLYLEKELVSFALENRTDNRVLIRQPGKGYYVDSIALMAEGKKYNAAIFGVVCESYMPDYSEDTRFCLSRSAVVPEAGYYTLFHCMQGEGCQHETTTPNWFELC